MKFNYLLSAIIFSNIVFAAQEPLPETSKIEEGSVPDYSLEIQSEKELNYLTTTLYSNPDIENQFYCKLGASLVLGSISVGYRMSNYDLRKANDHSLNFYIVPWFKKFSVSPSYKYTRLRYTLNGNSYLGIGGEAIFFDPINSKINSKKLVVLPNIELVSGFRISSNGSGKWVQTGVNLLPIVGAVGALREGGALGGIVALAYGVSAVTVSVIF